MWQAGRASDPPNDTMSDDVSTRPLRIDYHMHTCYSHDSETPLDAVVARAAEAGIGRLCVTDHDTIEGARELARIAGPDLEVVVGCEFTADDGSQVVGLHLHDMIHEPRLPQLMDRIHEQGGTVLLPHPFRRGSGIFRPEARRSEAFIADVLERTDLVECFNGRDSYDNNEANLAFARERGLAAVASSDAHDASRIGTVFVEYEVAGGAVQDGITPGWVHFPDQVARREHPLKRSLMERYHRHRDRLPGAVEATYRSLRRRYHAGRTRPVTPTHRQYRLPAAAADVEQP